MKRFLLTLALAVLIALPARADGNGDAVTDILCRLEGEVAFKVMRNRQNGVALSDTMAVFNQNQPSNKADRARMRAMVVEAYSMPMFSTPANKRRAAEEFGNAAMVACYKARI